VGHHAIDVEHLAAQWQFVLHPGHQPKSDRDLFLRILKPTQHYVGDARVEERVDHCAWPCTTASGKAATGSCHRFQFARRSAKQGQERNHLVTPVDVAHARNRSCQHF